MRNPWLQLFGLLALVSGGITAYNEVGESAYSQPSRQLDPDPPPPTPTQGPASPTYPPVSHRDAMMAAMFAQDSTGDTSVLEGNYGCLIHLVGSGSPVWASSRITFDSRSRRFEQLDGSPRLSGAITALPSGGFDFSGQQLVGGQTSALTVRFAKTAPGRFRAILDTAGSSIELRKE